MIPKYHVISREILQRIRDGEYPVGGVLPNEPQLAKEFGVARGTVRKALQNLQKHGAVHTVHGKGTYVLAGTVEGSIAQSLIGLKEAFSLLQQPTDTQVLTHEVVSGAALEFLPESVSPAEDFLHLHRVRTVDGVPVADLHNWVRLALVPEIAGKDFEQTGLFNALDELSPTPVTTGRRTFKARKAPLSVAERMLVEPDDPLLYLEQTTFLLSGEIVEWSRVWLNSERVDVSANLVR